ncbi:MAG: flavodoxin [Eubacteriales bacterium]|nr:flavodoxin [Eubacteriales bacterium]
MRKGLPAAPAHPQPAAERGEGIRKGVRRRFHGHTDRILLPRGRKLLRRRVAQGSTEKVAKTLSELTGGTLLKIEQARPYSEDYQTCIAQAKRDLQANARPEAPNLPDSLDGYDEIYLGYPNYWGTMPMAVYTFLEKYDLSGKTIRPFCTHEGSGLSGTVERIRKICRGANVMDGLALNGTAVQNRPKQVKRQLEAFVREN